ncbi:asparagine synthase (glutamine-hydrolyzing) [Vibrio vulnificus]|nr:asparagine synthase (glutamine-hydrolyzing) [Vibrio vulnificus]
MCGIVGAIGDLESSLVEDMVQQMSHRGPDNISTYSSENVHLGHARLSIIDLSQSSNQPLWDVQKKACIVFNGEIYNYKELQTELESQGIDFNSSGDAEVLLNMYLAYGIKALNKISGIFSFAIWDDTKQSLVVARDHYGVKPLYYVQQDGEFYFASEIKSLLCIPKVKKEINLDTLFRTLIFLWNPGEETLLEGVKKVKPAHYMIVKDGAVAKYERYWSWPAYNPQNTVPESTHQSRVLDAVRGAVEEQLVADVKVGSFLSGGLDSSLIVALAAHKLDGKIDTFTIDSGGESQSKEGFSDDLPYAKQVAGYLGVELDVLKVNPDIVSLLPKMIYHLDELQADPAPLNVLLICENAKKQGIKVLLSGAGGDDIFTGYRRHYAVTAERYWSWLPKFGRTVLKGATQCLPKGKASSRRVAKAFQYADLDGDERLLSYFYWMDPKVARDLFAKPEKISASPMQFILDEMADVSTDDPVERMLTLEQKYFLVDHNFNYTDKMSMATGVEVRVPFLDKNVVNVASQVPSKLKQKGRIGKSILKKAAEEVLPNSVIYRSKSGFGAPLRAWLKGDLAELVDDLLSVEKVKARGIFNAEKIQALLAEDRANKADYSYPIFAMLCFELWCQQFID